MFAAVHRRLSFVATSNRLAPQLTTIRTVQLFPAYPGNRITSDWDFSCRVLTRLADDGPHRVCRLSGQSIWVTGESVPRSSAGRSISVRVRAHQSRSIVCPTSREEIAWQPPTTEV
ncbi:MAG: hypothetical protein M3548_21505 [Actinomycetota bacterium]|nr:hypothetical protein [Actinomycetota bacterium]